MSAGMADRLRTGRRIRRLVPGITNRYCGPSFETATEPVIGRAFARPVGGLLRGCECISDLILRSLRSKHLEARAASRHDLRDVTALHARTYLARNFLMMGEKNEPRGFLVSPRPVSRCAICRNILAVR